VTVAEEVRKAIQARIDALRADPDFQARLRDHLERNREILKGLASTYEARCPPRRPTTSSTSTWPTT
jgi:hypothetical protein